VLRMIKKSVVAALEAAFVLCRRSARVGSSAAQEIPDRRARNGPRNGCLRVPAVELRENSDAEKIAAGVTIPE
jgi:hypothetical protein